MDDLAVGRLLRALRIRRNWRQTDVAEAARVSRSGVSRAERGQLDGLRVVDLREIARAMDVRMPFSPSWLGGERDRVLNERHASMQEHLARIFEQLRGWTCDQEVTFSVFGERGSIDALAWHASCRALLVIELKTELADPAALLAQVDRYRRLAMGIARGRDWDPTSVSAWVLVADSSMNRRRLARHRSMLRTRFPEEGRTMRPWLRNPTAAAAALSFMADARQGSTAQKAAPRKRVSRQSGSILEGARPEDHGSRSGHEQ